MDQILDARSSLLLADRGDLLVDAVLEDPVVAASAADGLEQRRQDLVARRLAEMGDMATPGKPLFIIYKPGELRVTASVPQYRMQQMRKVKTARVEFPETDKWLDATSVNLLPTADVSTHVSQIRVTLPPTDEATPGMFARVHFAFGQDEKLTVPRAAVLRRGEVAAVYVENADGRLSLRQIRLGEAVGQGEVEVLAGLAAGDKVVTDPVRAGIQLKAGK